MHFSFTLMLVLSYSIFIAGIIGAVRFSQIGEIYRPFIYLIWIGCFNELLSTYLMFNGYYTIANNAIYDLCESLLLLWFFKTLGVLKNQTLFYALMVVFILSWTAEIIFVTHLTDTFIRYFYAIDYLTIVLLSIRAVNNLLFTEKDLGKNPTFLICIGMICFFTYGVINRMFWLFDLKISTDFFNKVQSINIIINFLANLIYALAVLWMQKRRAFTLQF